MSLDKSLHMQLKTLFATLFNGSVHTSHMWSDLSSNMHRRCTFITHLLAGLQHQSNYTVDLQ